MQISHLKKYWLLYILGITFVVCVVLLIVLYSIKAKSEQNDNLKAENPLSEIYNNNTSKKLLPAINHGDCIVAHKYFTLCYNENYEQAEWVYYTLTSEMTIAKAGRNDNFRADPLVPTQTAYPYDYKKSGYDKGHLCPAADMSFSAEAMSETFFMSNISPQVPQFNRGIWKKLEEKIRNWAKKHQELHITTGPVIAENHHTIGKNKVAVPQYFYKVILDYKQPGLRGIGFIMKNENTEKNIYEFAVSIDSVENFTGINFFEALPDSIEKILEKQNNFFDW